MQQKSKNRIRFVLFLFVFGIVLLVSVVGSAIQSSESLNEASLLVIVLGVLCIALAAYLVNKHWY